MHGILISSSTKGLTSHFVNLTEYKAARSPKNEKRIQVPLKMSVVIITCKKYCFAIYRYKYSREM